MMMWITAISRRIRLKDSVQQEILAYQAIQNLKISRLYDQLPNDLPEKLRYRLSGGEIGDRLEKWWNKVEKENKLCYSEASQASLSGS